MSWVTPVATEVLSEFTPSEVNLLKAAQLTAQMVTAAAERGSVSEALDAQRTATGVVSAVTAEQIAKSPDGDAAAAVKRVSGVTVQDGKYVFVRGLGERYTTSSLNGARVPSPEPEKRVVPLDMFPAGLLQSIKTAKTFTPDLQGDFSGALVDIKTREFPARRSFSFQAGSGYAAGATGAQVASATSTGGEEFAMVLVNVGADRAALIAERIRALGHRAPGTYREFIDLTSINEDVGSPSADKMIQLLVEGQEAVVRTARSIFPVVEKAGDQPTADLLTQRMQIHEKTAWMLRSLLEK